MTDLSTLPDHLLVPLLDAAAATLRALPPADVPAAARALLGFDRRGLNRGPARRQLRRALEDDAAFREQTFTVFGMIPEVQAVLEGWIAAEALALASSASDRDELPLLAGALVAAGPEGADFGLGVIVAIDAARNATAEDARRAEAIAARLAETQEGRRRLDAERLALVAERDALAEQLRNERRARRDRDERVTTDVAGVEQRMAALEGDVERERSRAERAEVERARALTRANELEVEAETRQHAASVEPVADADALAAAARAASELAARLEGLVTNVAKPASEISAGPGAGDRRPQARVANRGATGGRRVRPRLPGGLVADSVAGAEAMLRSGSVLLVVDGYNVSKTAGSAASLAVERESLVRALEGFQLTCGIEVLVVFDGDGTPAFAKAARRGVRVVFSSPGEEADSVVVEIVASTPLQTPVIVASSDRWVREHAETFGAVVVSAATLLGVLRKAPGRSAS